MSDGSLCPIHPMDIQSIQIYLECHTEAYHKRFISIPIPHGMWKESPLSWCSTL